MSLNYTEWQKLRNEMRDREIAERQTHLDAPRPPLQVSISDQIMRDLLHRVAQLEKLVSGLTQKQSVTSKY